MLADAAQGLLGGPSLRHVLDQREADGGAAVDVSDEGDDQVPPREPAVLADVAFRQLVAVALAVEQLLPERDVRGNVVGVRVLRKAQRADLLAAVADELAERPVRLDRSAVEVDQADPDLRLLEDRAQPPSASWRTRRARSRSSSAPARAAKTRRIDSAVAAFAQWLTVEHGHDADVLAGGGEQRAPDVALGAQQPEVVVIRKEALDTLRVRAERPADDRAARGAGQGVGHVGGESATLPERERLDGRTIVDDLSDECVAPAERERELLDERREEARAGGGGGALDDRAQRRGDAARGHAGRGRSRSRPSDRRARGARG